MRSIRRSGSLTIPALVVMLIVISLLGIRTRQMVLRLRSDVMLEFGCQAERLVEFGAAIGKSKDTEARPASLKTWQVSVPAARARQTGKLELSSLEDPERVVAKATFPQNSRWQVRRLAITE